MGLIFGVQTDRNNPGYFFTLNRQIIVGLFFIVKFFI